MPDISYQTLISRFNELCRRIAKGSAYFNTFDELHFIYKELNKYENVPPAEALEIQLKYTQAVSQKNKSPHRITYETYLKRTKEELLRMVEEKFAELDRDGYKFMVFMDVSIAIAALHTHQLSDCEKLSVRNKMEALIKKGELRSLDLLRKLTSDKGTLRTKGSA